MQAIAEQMVLALPAESVVVGTPIRKIGRDEVIDHHGERCAASVVVDARSLSGDDGGVAHRTAVHYCEVPIPLPNRRTLYVGAGEESLLHVVAPVSEVQPTYAPSGRHLVAVTCYPHITEELGREALVQRILEEVSSWFGFERTTVRYLTSYDIPRALGRFFSLTDRVPMLREGRYQIGDITEYPSLNGAFLSGRLVTERILRRRVT